MTRDITSSIAESDRAGLPDEAADLLLRFQAQPDDPSLAAEVAEWRGRSEDHARAWMLAERFWTAAGQIDTAHPVFEKSRRPSPTRRTARWRGRGKFAGGLALAAAACLALVMLPSIRIALQADYQTGTGEMQHFTLKDGSVVHLDTNSSVAINEGAQARGVTLLAGRAWFDVAKDRNRPFKVAAGEITVTVTGTQFDVGINDKAVDVDLGEGSVRASYPGARGTGMQALVPGDHFHFDRETGRSRMTRKPVAAMAAWRHGKLLTQGASVAEMADQLRPYYPGTIIITDDRLARSQVTGAFDLDNPAEALRMIVEPHNGKVRQITPWLLFVSAS